MDFRLKIGRTMQVVGPSGSGKTLFTINLLKMRNQIFEVPLKKVWWFYGAEEGEIGLSKTEIATLKNIEFVNGLQDEWQKLPQRHDVVVIDDLFIEASNDKELTNLFTRTARHRQIFVIFLTQNMFQQQQNRSRNINTHYLVLFKNPRDTLSIGTISRQMGNTTLHDIFQDATKNKPYGYLFIDFTQECPDEFRIRTNILNPSSMIIYKKKDL